MSDVTLYIEVDGIKCIVSGSSESILKIQTALGELAELKKHYNEITMGKGRSSYYNG